MRPLARTQLKCKFSAQKYTYSQNWYNVITFEAALFSLPPHTLGNYIDFGFVARVFPVRKMHCRQ
ncbi:unnamed protein product [Chondrus crispus]|uniref:Uncharacterized protein n=1 Tax=Chondrus crispus TaxID=2769 RepID=R7QPB2_CHOCR|nr:unnamed protein product [Chondrus crispus]CDF39608.1 unnamed protein product [Chondrus crispus]|eukprot:XP_005709902.1 unnamed protein product [Chondrus crispus]